MGDDFAPPEKADAPFDWRKALSDRAQWLVVFIVGVSVAGALGRYHWVLELFSHYVAWYALGAAILATFFWIIRSRRWATGTTLLAVVLAFAPLSWYFPARNPNVGGVRCRVLLANVLTSNRNHQAVLDLIAAEDPDVVCLQEINDAWENALEPLRETYPTYHAVPRNDNFGIALYSRVTPGLPAAAFDGKMGVPALTAPIEMDGAQAQLLNIHALPPLRADMARRRSAQLEGARAWLDAQTLPAIIIGDLNMTMYSPVYRAWAKNLKAKNARQGYGPLGSWPLFVPIMRLPLDQALVTPDIEVLDCRLGPDIGSDHLPLIVDVRLPVGAAGN